MPELERRKAPAHGEGPLSRFGPAEAHMGAMYGRPWTRAHTKVSHYTEEGLSFLESRDARV